MPTMLKYVGRVANVYRKKKNVSPSSGMNIISTNLKKVEQIIHDARSLIKNSDLLYKSIFIHYKIINYILKGEQ